MIILNLTQHVATPEQVEAGVVEPVEKKRDAATDGDHKADHALPLDRNGNLRDPIIRVKEDFGVKEVRRQTVMGHRSVPG